MKKVVFIVGLAFLLFAGLSGISRASDSPEAVFKKYIKAVKDGKFEEVSKYLPKTMVDFYTKQPDSVKKTYLAVQRGTLPEEFTVKDVKINGKQAVLKYEGIGREGKEGTQFSYKATVTFMEENGNWKYMQETREQVKK
ncbi:MAG: nuclear transport factor 2 family protein [Firmicutes bacterium]|nr:nuclear transport factor 2 family protein [Bacillota bacterium]